MLWQGFWAIAPSSAAKDTSTWFQPYLVKCSRNQYDYCSLWRYALQCDEVIKSFRHKGLKRFFETGSKAGIQAAHATKLRLQLAALDQAVKPEDLSAPSWDLHSLKGDLKGHWALTVTGNWRMVFTFEGVDAVLVDYKDYH